MGADALNERLVEHLRRNGALTEDAVATAFLAVRRHWFLPGWDLDRVYTDDALVTKQRGGLPVSSSSQPAIMAIMLEQLMLAPGLRTLEIGTGTGYNAGLIAHLVGAGNVVTVDYDRDLANLARARLAACGFGGVTTVAGDGAIVPARLGTFDRIILTAAAWDIVPAWFEALREGGIIVLPLSFGGPQVSVAFLKSGGVLTSQSIQHCGFMAVQGAGVGPRVAVPNARNDSVAIHEWPETLPDDVLWRGIESAVAPLDLSHVRAGAEMPGDIIFALALAGWRIAHVTGVSPATACFPPDSALPALIRADGSLGFEPGGSGTGERFWRTIEAWREAGAPPVAGASIEAVPLERQGGVETSVRPGPGGRVVFEKRHFRYTLDLRP